MRDLEQELVLKYKIELEELPKMPVNHQGISCLLISDGVKEVEVERTSSPEVVEEEVEYPISSFVVSREKTPQPATPSIKASVSTKSI